MKRTVRLVLVCVLLACMLQGLTACSKKVEPEKLVCGITDFEPMNFKDAKGNWTGFDTEFAQAVGKKLNMEVVFQLIAWDNKYSELESGAIKCVWNGFTANVSDADGKARSEKVDFSYGYMLNQQCIVIKADRADEFAAVEDLVGKSAAAEKGSAGESAAKELVGEAGTIIDSAAQIDTFREIKSGAVDCAVVDILLAQKIAGSGDYADLAIADITLGSEVYAIGFKKGSPLTAKVNTAIKALYDDGTLATIAKKYNLENSLTLLTEIK